MARPAPCSTKYTCGTRAQGTGVSVVAGAHAGVGAATGAAAREGAGALRARADAAQCSANNVQKGGCAACTLGPRTRRCKSRHRSIKQLPRGREWHRRGGRTRCGKAYATRARHGFYAVCNSNVSCVFPRYTEGVGSYPISRRTSRIRYPGVIPELSRSYPELSHFVGHPTLLVEVPSRAVLYMGIQSVLSCILTYLHHSQNGPTMGE